LLFFSSALHAIVLSKAPAKKRYTLISLCDNLKIDSRKDHDGRTALHLAVILNDREIIERLIRLEKISLSVNTSDNKRQTPLHIAAKKNYSNIALSLIRKLKSVLADSGRTPNVDLPDVAGRTPLHLAAMRGNVESVRLFLERGADPLRQDKSGKDTFLLAVAKGQMEIVELLCSKIESEIWEKRDDNGWSALHLVGNKHNGDRAIEIIEWIRSKKQQSFDPNVRDKKDRTPVHLAVLNLAPVTVVKQLLQCGADLNAVDMNGTNALHFAGLAGNEAVIAFLKEQGFDSKALDARGNGFQHFAAYGSNDLARMIELVGLEFDEKSPNKSGMTMMHHAVIGNNVRSIRALVERGASVDGVDLHLLSPLHYAAFYGKNRAFDVLVELGARPLASDDHRRTPLHYAAYAGHARLCEVLVRLVGVKGDLGDKHSQTPLHLASLAGHVEVVKLLLAHSFSKTKVNVFGELPMEVAEDNDEITALFNGESSESGSESDSSNDNVYY
jgi:ankyrin repeat protein